MRGFHISAILILRPPTRYIIRATVDTSSIPIICMSSRNILVTFCWFQLAKRVDRHQSWRKTKLNCWSVRRVFVWRRHFLPHKLLWCTSFVLIVFKIPQTLCNSTLLRQNDIVFAWYDFSTGKLAWGSGPAQSDNFEKWYILKLSEMIFWNCKDTFENKIEYPEQRLSSREQRSKQHNKSPKALSSEMRYTC